MEEEGDPTPIGSGGCSRCPIRPRFGPHNGRRYLVGADLSDVRAGNPDRPFREQWTSASPPMPGRAPSGRRAVWPGRAVGSLILQSIAIHDRERSARRGGRPTGFPRRGPLRSVRHASAEGANPRRAPTSLDGGSDPNWRPCVRTGARQAAGAAIALPLSPQGCLVHPISSGA
jgi:hypothetical protein